MNTSNLPSLSAEAIRQIAAAAGIPLDAARCERLAHRYERLMQDIRELDGVDPGDAEPAVRFRPEG
ncbi:MAG: hypothetical protein Q7T26_09175 [Dehalococcoidia bacterium]|nr:hypothetical protein [Dehalococcoidia bacterium]